MENEQKTQAESSPADVNAESSTVENQSAEATAKQATEKEVPFNEHPRWKEIQEEKRQAVEAAANAKAQAEYYRGIAEASKLSKEEIQDKIYEANTPEEKRFYETIEKIAEQKVLKSEKALEARLRKEYEESLKSRDTLVGQFVANEFLKSHPDLKKGTAEMGEITRKAQLFSSAGIPLTEALDEAYKSVMFEKNAQMAVEAERKKTQQKTQDKIAANVETKGVNTTAIPSKKSGGGDIQMSEFEATAKELGLTL